MEISTIVIIILSMILVLLFYGIYNAGKKIADMEDVIDTQVDYINKISYIIRDSKENLDKLDEKGAFKSDDEVGLFFESLKNIQKLLDSFIVPENYGKKKT